MIALQMELPVDFYVGAQIVKILIKELLELVLQHKNTVNAKNLIAKKNIVNVFREEIHAVVNVDVQTAKTI